MSFNSRVLMKGLLRSDAGNGRVVLVDALIIQFISLVEQCVWVSASDGV